MKRVSLLIALLLAFSLTACSASSNTPDNESSAASQTPPVSESIPAASDGSQSEANSAQPAGEGNILIAYFSWADNTVVENPEEIDVDATASASVLEPGNTALMAQHLQQATGGDLFSIVAAEPYSSNYDECLDRAADELDEEARPALAATVEDMEQYDIIFLGLPNWWNSIPMPVATFLESYSFDGKTVVPFVAHGTSGIGGTTRAVEQLCPNATLLEAFGAYRDDMDTLQADMDVWLESLDLS